MTGVRPEREKNPTVSGATGNPTSSKTRSGCSDSIAFRVFLCKELAGNDPVLVAAHERPPDMKVHPAFACVGMLKDLLLHVRIGRSRLMAFGTQKCVRLVFQPEIDARTVFRVFNSRNLPVLRKFQQFLKWFSCGHSAILPLHSLVFIIFVRKPITITQISGFVKLCGTKKTTARRTWHPPPKKSIPAAACYTTNRFTIHPPHTDCKCQDRVLCPILSW